MAIFTKAQLEKLVEVVHLNVSWLMRRLLGESAASESKQESLPTESTDLARRAFVAGELESVMQDAEWKKLSPEILTEAASKNQTPAQEAQIATVRVATAITLRGLEYDVSKKLTELLRSKIQAGSKLDYASVIADLHKQFPDIKRNWRQVITNELHSAHQQGVVSAILSGTDVYRFADGPDSKVKIILDSGACADCRRVYTDSGESRVFKLSELLENAGSNYKRPWRSNAKPVIPPLHPRCLCRLKYIPPSATAKSLSECEPMQKSQPHEMLHGAANLIPTEDDIKTLGSVDEVHAAMDKVEALKKMYQENPEVYHKLDWLRAQLQGRYSQLVQQQEPSDGTEQ